MDLKISGRVALVLGAGGGLGSAISRQLAQEGVSVALADVDEQALAATAASIEEDGGRCITHCWELGDRAAADRHVSQIEQQFGPVDILVNNTGGPPPSEASGVDPEVWAKQFNAMVLSVIAITDRILPGMRARKWGRVITSSSSGIIAPIPNLAMSNALRMSLVGWSKSLAREVAADNVTVNVILPGRIATSRIRYLDVMKAERQNRPLDAVISESVASIPMARYGTPAEYADVVTFLASERASYMTGSIVRVDGGYLQSV
ncbi:SDR family oxidoreductase [Cupriavidus basilensis]|uniref:SDR family oxidoreductase n=1 Tax=Cupriavidus basilensis TaxID=68895 RepID=UPI0005BA7C7E|nr:SDR family oxidoreductase [Cupriavidus basilensis]